MTETSRVFSVMLAAGRGTRMGNESTPKVCMQVAGVPFILRSLQSYQEAGVDSHVVVIGAGGGEVVRTVDGRVPRVCFAVQPTPLGTGNAARCGVECLAAAGYEGAILLVMGDRWLAPAVVRRMLTTFEETGSDLTLLVADKSQHPSCGRLVEASGGRPVAIVETADIRLSRLVGELSERSAEGRAVPSADLQAMISPWFPKENKARAACGALYEMVYSEAEVSAEALAEALRPLREKVTLRWEEEGGTREIPMAQVEDRARWASLGSYLFRAPVLYEALGNLKRDNAQGEEYLTDVVRLVSAARKGGGQFQYALSKAAVEAPDETLTFNTPAELAEVQRRLRIISPSDLQLVERPELLQTGTLRTVAEWHTLFALNMPTVQSFMSETYGLDPGLQEARRVAYAQALECYAHHHGMQEEVFIVRSPGRLNLLGRHIDHRGGFTNVVAMSEEVLMVCAPRDDDLIALHNTNEADFDADSFSVAEEAGALGPGDWQAVVNDARTLAAASQGRWSNYFKAAALRLQAAFPEIPLQGLNIVTHGTIPMGAGLSSSSALVVGASEALIARNRLPVHAHMLVDLCGEGEWFVGTRGGSGDHAAIKFGRRGQVVRFSFLPFRVCAAAPFVPGHLVVVCNSGLQAKKSENAREIFNSRVLGYVVGEILFKRLYPQHAGRVQRVRDITCENLGISLEELYGLLKGIPEEMSVAELLETYGPCGEEETAGLETILTTLPRRDVSLAVRGVMLFGLAECERSARCLDYLGRQDAEGLGELWYLSHDGDRVVAHGEDMAAFPWNYTVDDAYLERLIGWLRSGDPEQVARAQLHLQPGRYACSTPEIDKIVDLARRVPGVKGAQMAGAGLGGCVMILVENSAAEGLMATLGEHGWTAGAYEFVDGAGLVVL